MSIKIRQWIEDNQQSIILTSFIILPYITLFAYVYSTRYMITQEAQVTVTASTLTVMLIVCLMVIGYGAQRFIEKHLAHRHWTIQYAAFGAAIITVFVYLDLMGYDVRFIPL